MHLKHFDFLAHDVVHKRLELPRHLLDFSFVLRLPPTKVFEDLLPLRVLGWLEQLVSGFSRKDLWGRLRFLPQFRKVPLDLGVLALVGLLRKSRGIVEVVGIVDEARTIRLLLNDLAGIGGGVHSALLLPSLLICAHASSIVLVVFVFIAVVASVDFGGDRIVVGLRGISLTSLLLGLIIAAHVIPGLHRRRNYHGRYTVNDRRFFLPITVDFYGLLVFSISNSVLIMRGSISSFAS
ncbi:MAG: hypothetical protein JST59_00335 [Actinobacteria bacterium]|nr:hypothetical protein [Actinomycetota bacterium]